MLVALHKPYGILSRFTPDGSKWRTLSDLGLPPRVYPVGRLDADSEGLLFLTDEPFVQSLLLEPRRRHRRIYWVQVEGSPGPESLALIARSSATCVRLRCMNPIPRRASATSSQKQVKKKQVRRILFSDEAFNSTGGFPNGGRGRAQR